MTTNASSTFPNGSLGYYFKDQYDKGIFACVLIPKAFENGSFLNGCSGEFSALNPVTNTAARTFGRIDPPEGARESSQGCNPWNQHQISNVLEGREKSPPIRKGPLLPPPSGVWCPGGAAPLHPRLLSVHPSGML
jgi:hypothetical protein